MEFGIFCVFLVVICLVAIWNNWIFHEEDGFAMRKRPGFFKFYWLLFRHPLTTLSGRVK